MSFIALLIGFALIGYGLSPFVHQKLDKLFVIGIGVWIIVLVSIIELQA